MVIAVVTAKKNVSTIASPSYPFPHGVVCCGELSGRATLSGYGKEMLAARGNISPAVSSVSHAIDNNRGICPTGAFRLFRHRS